MDINQIIFGTIIKRGRRRHPSIDCCTYPGVTFAISQTAHLDSVRDSSGENSTI